MLNFILCVELMVMIFSSVTAVRYFNSRNIDCGPYGFICEGHTKLRLCEGNNLFGPTFVCPANTICNEDSSDVCENTINYIEPSLSRTIRCRRYERVADASVSGCKGYILCIPNKNRFQGIKFKCSGSTVFNGYTRACTAPDKYKCPLANTTDTNEFFVESNRRIDSRRDEYAYDNTGPPLHRSRPIDCKQYKFKVTQDESPVKAAYFCPAHPVPGESSVRCTVFSNQFCLTLERYDEDQFIENSQTAYRRPRKEDSINRI